MAQRTGNATITILPAATNATHLWVEIPTKLPPSGLPPKEWYDWVGALQLRLQIGRLWRLGNLLSTCRYWLWRLRDGKWD